MGCFMLIQTFSFWHAVLSGLKAGQVTYKLTKLLITEVLYYKKSDKALDHKQQKSKEKRMKKLKDIMVT